MSPSRLKTRPTGLLKLSAMSLVVATLSGCGEDAKDCGGFWDKTFGREECTVAPSTMTPQTLVQTAVLAKNTTLIEAEETQKITESVVNDSTGLTDVTVTADSAIAKAPVGGVVVIEGGRDSRYPLGLSGRVVSSKLADGVQQVELAPVTLAEAFDKLNTNYDVSFDPEHIIEVVPLSGEVDAPIVQAGRVATKNARAALAATDCTSESAKDRNKGFVLLKGECFKSEFEGTGSAEQVLVVNNTKTGLEFNIKRPFYDADGNPDTPNDQVKLAVNLKFENSQAHATIDKDGNDIKSIKAIKLKHTGSFTGSVSLSGKVDMNTDQLTGFSDAWKQVEKKMDKKLGFKYEIKGLSADDKKNKLPLACAIASAETMSLSAIPVLGSGQLEQTIKKVDALGGVVCFYINLGMSLKGDVSVGATFSKTNMDYGIDVTLDKNGNLVSQKPEPAVKSDDSLSSETHVWTVPEIKGNIKFTQTLGANVDVDGFAFGIRPITISAFVGEEGFLDAKGEIKGEYNLATSDYRYTSNGCISGNLGVGAKFAILANLGVEVNFSVAGWANAASVQGAYELRYPSKDDETKSGRQGLWYNLVPSQSAQGCFGTAKIYLPDFVHEQTGTTEQGYPVYFSWPNAVVKDVIGDKKTWEFMIDGQKYPFEVSSEEPFFIHTFENAGEHDVVLTVKESTAKKKYLAKKIMVKAPVLQVEPATSVVGGLVKVTVQNIADLVLSVGETIKEIFWTVVNAFGETITTMKTAINTTFEHVFDRRGDYAVSAQIYDESLQAISPKLNQSINIQECTQDCPAMLVIGVSPTTMAVNEPITIEVLAENVPSTAVFALDGAVCSTPLLSANAQGYVKITEVCTPIKTGTTKLSVKSQAGLTSGFTTVDVNVVAAKQVKGLFVVPAKSEGVVFVPPLDNEPAIGELGYVLEYGASRRNMTCSFTSTGQTKTYRSYDLVDANGYSTEVLPLLNGFPNMALIANNTLIGKEKTGLTFAAGQSLNFKLNDDSYGDNEGALTVSYDCVESSMTGAFTVPANLETGVAFTSPSSTKPLQCGFTASGTWINAGQTLDATGDAGFTNPLAPRIYDGAPYFSLIANKGTGYDYIGTSNQFVLSPAQQVKFLMNEGTGSLASYNDNSGALTVNYTCSEIPQPTWTPNPANGHQYAAVDCGTWTQCEAQAVALGAHLVTINDAAEQQWIRSTFVTNYYWTGLTDRDIEGTWKWISGDTSAYSNWSTLPIAQPDNFQGNQNYAYFGGSNTGSDGKWDDVNEANTLLNARTYGIFEKSSGITATISASSATPVAGTAVTLSLIDTVVDGITSVVWKVGDTIVKVLASIADAFEYIFDKSGTYTITASLKDADDQVVLAPSLSVQVASQPPVASLVGSSMTSTVGQSVNFILSGSKANEGKLCSYLFDNGQGLDAGGSIDCTDTSQTLPLNTINMQYTAIGTYTATLTVTDSQGKSATTTWLVNVAEAPQIADTGKLNDTGITQCANANTIFADCSAASLGGWFGLNQDGEVGRDALAAKGQLTKVGAGDAGFDFTKISATGQKLPANATEWSCVLDNHTGLMWEVKTNDGGLRDSTKTYTWYNSDTSTNGGAVGYKNGDKNTETFTQAVNAQGLCGYIDWRLPNKQELHSIVNYGKNNPAIDSTYFPNTQGQGSWYWSSSPVANDSNSAWIVHFVNGYDGNDVKYVNIYVRLVRSGQ